MRRYLLSPEVAGGLGDKTRHSVTWHPAAHRWYIVSVDFLDYRFDGWEGDAIVNHLNLYAVTEPFATALVNAGLSGFSLRDMTVTASDVWEQFCEDRPDQPTPPAMKQLIPETECEIESVDGSWRIVSECRTDVCFGVQNPDVENVVAPVYGLVVSARFMKLARKFGLESASIDRFDNDSA